MATYIGTSSYAVAKESCYLCGRNEGLVDLDVSIVGEGSLALCKGCIQEAAEAAGLHLNEAAVTEERTAFRELERRFAPERIEQLEAELAAAQAALTNEQRLAASLQDALTRIGKPAAQKPATARK